ncbi:helix-turn-helix domain containing protein [Crossiella sp. CA-258035]|uniref:TetR/AcrR family transcriptional regulator n=1 Tax=Crossiella sp. CA-258035 TaxID=2981138 RepID=UPI0024BCBD85|nr:TetR/AcrR family transcriptional regulator [Crossiella sp. CA-258035]WHT20607.1 helix-turn-helix domain containing protein [Crossiella sp. CA-258035]
MARLTRAELQELNRAKILDAARAEFAERGYRDAKIDDIADRAGLTRGAVYSNFPGKRALYFAVLAGAALGDRGAPEPVDGSVRGALAGFARSWLARTANPELLGEVLAEEDTRGVYAQLLEIQSVLFGPLLCAGEGDRGERRARLALTVLHGANQLATLAPEFVAEDAVVAACAQLADLPAADTWRPPADLPPVTRPNLAWPELIAVCTVHATPIELNADGLILFLGPDRLGAVEDLVRGTDEPVTVVAGALGSSELRLLAGLTLAGFGHNLRAAGGGPGQVKVVCDASAPSIAERLGVTGPETAVRVENARITARADGPGAGYALTR